MLGRWDRRNAVLVEDGDLAAWGGGGGGVGQGRWWTWATKSTRIGPVIAVTFKAIVAVCTAVTMPAFMKFKIYSNQLGLLNSVSL